ASTASSCTVDQLLRHADLAMYAAKREGGQCIRSFVPDVPFPYTFPQFDEPALSATQAASVYQDASSTYGPAGSTGNETPPARAPRPMSEVATSSRYQPDDAPPGILWPPTAIRIALAVLAIGVMAFTASSVLNPDNGHSVFFAKFLYSALNLLAAGLIA